MRQVVAALIVREGKVLICQRTKHQTMPLKWEFPGGKVEPDEQHKAALSRELDEELGIDASVGRKIASIRHTYSGGGSVELHFFLVHHFEGELQNRIFRDVRWVEKQELPTFDFLEADIELVKQIAAGKLTLD